MSKNKFMWGIALFLILIASLPIAHAQTFTGSRLFFILINSAIVFVILFLLQSFLIPKDGKEKASVLVAVITASLLIGFLYGQSGFIWQGPLGRFFSTYVLVNAAIIAAVLYFVLGLLDREKKLTPSSPQGQTGYGILLFLVAVIFAVKLGNQWIWNTAVLIQFRDYLFGAEGILNVTRNPEKFFVFVGTFALIVYFFNSYLMKNAGKSVLMNYFLALIIAASTAQAGMGINAVIQLGEIIFWITISDAIGGVTQDNKFRFSLGALLVGWASAAITATNPEHRGIIGKLVGNLILAPLGIGIETAPITGKEAGGALIGIISSNFTTFLIVIGILLLMYTRGQAGGWTKGIGGGGLILIPILLIWSVLPSLGFAKWILIPLGIIVLILIFGGLAFGIGRGERRAETTWGRLKTYGLNPFLSWMKKSPNPFIKWFLRKWTATDPYIDGTLPFIFRQLRAELMILMNWQTRLHTYLGKRGKVQEAVDKVKGIERNFKGTEKTYDELSYILDRHRFAGADDIDNSTGWSNNRQLIAFFFNRLKSDLESSDIRKPHGQEEGVRRGYSNDLAEALNQRLDAISRSYTQFEDDAKKFGMIHRLRSLKIHILDLLALYGVYKHYYRFANENAVYERWTYDSDKDIDKGLDEDGKKQVDDPVVWSLKIDSLSNDKTYGGYVLYERAVKAQHLKIKQKKEDEIRAQLRKKYIDEVIEKMKKDTRNPTPPQKYISNFLNRNDVKDWIENQVKAELPNYSKEIEYDTEAELKGREAQEAIRESIPGDYKLDFVARTADGDLRHEVDIKGFVLEDIHKIEVGHENPGYIRRVRIEDIEDFPGTTQKLFRWSFIYENIDKEWGFFIQDLRYGVYHPKSRSHDDYTAVLSKRSLDLLDPNITTTQPNIPNPAAFDMESLKFSGKWVYWGCKKYWDSAPDMGNPYPTLSTIALSRIITEIVKLRAGENQITDRFLSYLVWDTGKDIEPFTALLGKEERT